MPSHLRIHKLQEIPQQHNVDKFPLVGQVCHGGLLGIIGGILRPKQELGKRCQENEGET